MTYLVLTWLVGHRLIIRPIIATI